MAGASDDFPREPDDPAEREAWRAQTAAAARERFAAIGRLPDAEIDLAEAALVIAAEEYPGLDVASYLHRVEALAERVRQRIAERSVAGTLGTASDPDEIAFEALHRVLFEEEGYAGAALEQTDDYYLPRNSFLNEVMERKRGLPITLSVLYCEVARRAGLDAVGVNAPGHFLAQFRGRHSSILLDPYNRGQRVEEERLRAAMTPASAKATLARMLTNLKLVYVQRHQFMKALAAVERILVVMPSPNEVRDRGIILRALGEQLLRDARARFDREKDQGSEAAGQALASLQIALQHAQYLFGSAWFDLNLYARLGEGSSSTATIAESASQVWHLLGRNN